MTRPEFNVHGSNFEDRQRSLTSAPYAFAEIER